MADLIPCPRCGANGVIKKSNSCRSLSPAYGKYRARCENPECLDHFITRYFETEKKAAEARNRRVENG